MNDGTGLVKLADVARLAGVGTATASRALAGSPLVREPTRKRVLEAARALSYVPNRTAQALKGGRSGMIGMIVPRLSDAFFAQSVDAVQALAVERSSQLVVAATNDGADRTILALRQLLQHSVDGLIVAISRPLTPLLLQTLKGVRTPVVGIDAPLTKAGLRSVLIDNEAKGLLATEHLVQHGYQQIVFLETDGALYTIREREKGYAAALRQAGLQPQFCQVGSQEEMTRFLLAHKHGKGALAFLACNEIATKHVLAAAKACGMSMPDDFGLIGFDDFDMADILETPLSVVRQPVLHIGEAAAKLLFQQLEEAETSPSQAGDLILQAELVLRSSCGC